MELLLIIRNRLCQDANTDDIADAYTADVLSYTDYYPFGMTMPGRQYTGGNYRYGFNGKELDDDGTGMGGGGSTYDYGFRIYNPSIGKFLSVDPLTRLYPMLTPYQFASNTPISAIDVDGLEGVQYLEKMVDENTGETVISRVIELDIVIIVDNRNFRMNSTHYTSNDINRIETGLNDQFNQCFVDKDGNEVKFRFNISTIQFKDKTVDQVSREMMKNPENYVLNEEEQMVAIKGVVLAKTSNNSAKMSDGKKEQFEGSSNRNVIRLSLNQTNEARTIAHEIIHKFLNYKPALNPKEDDADAHDALGGAMSYKNRDLPVSQENVNVIIESVPVVDNSKK